MEKIEKRRFRKHSSMRHNRDLLAVSSLDTLAKPNRVAVKTASLNFADMVLGAEIKLLSTGAESARP